MKITVVASPRSAHQSEHATALASGLIRHGHEVLRSASSGEVQTDTVACWGWRQGQIHHQQGRKVLVMERGYIGDRFEWTSLGWNGLNNRATFPEIKTPERFRKHFASLMQPWSPSGDYVLLAGQVHGDMSLQGRDLQGWYMDMAHKASEVYGLPVRFRQHPVERQRGLVRRIPGTLPGDGPLADELTNCAAVITFNSNTAVESVLAGKPTVTFDEGSMAWPVTAHVLGEEVSGNREGWASQLAWKQWRLDEMASGEAVEHLLRVMP